MTGLTHRSDLGVSAGPQAAHRIALAGWPALVAVALAVWLLRALLSANTGASLHVDEAQYWDWSSALQWGYYSKPPGIAALLALSRSLFGDSEPAARALAQLCWPAAAVVLALLARDQARLERGAGQPESDAAAWWALAMLLCSPLAGLLGLVATTDALLMLAWAAGLAGLWWGVVHQRRSGWMLYTLAIGLGLLSKYTCAALCLGGLLWVASQRSRPALRAWSLATAAALLLWMPNLWWNQGMGWPTLHHTSEITVAAPASGSRGPAAALFDLLGFGLAQMLIFAPLLLPAWAAWALRWRAAPAVVVQVGTDGQGAIAATGAGAFTQTRRRLLLLTSLPLAAAGLLQAWHRGAEVNWIAPVHLAAALWLAPQLAAMPVRWRQVAGVALAVQAVLVAALALAPRWAGAPHAAWPPALDLWTRLRGWQPAFLALKPTLARHPQAWVIGTSRAVLAHAGYHLRDLPLQRMAWAPGAPAAHHYALQCPWQGQRPPAGQSLLVLSEGPPPADLQQRLGPLRLLAREDGAVRPGRVVSLWLMQAEASAGTPPMPSGRQAFCR
jgi:4-amino-4-deoxy-L-arabinose transferase-like glycosyltransferase